MIIDKTNWSVAMKESFTEDTLIKCKKCAETYMVSQNGAWYMKKNQMPKNTKLVASSCPKCFHPVVVPFINPEFLNK